MAGPISVEDSMRIALILLCALLAAALPALAEPAPPKVQEAADRAVPAHSTIAS